MSKPGSGHRAGQPCHMRLTSQYDTLWSVCVPLPEAGDQCGSSLRWDLCGGGG